MSCGPGLRRLALAGACFAPLAAAAQERIEVFVVSDQDKKNLEQLNIKPPILVTGDTRFDQIALKKNIPTDLNKLQLRKNIFIAGSTWPEDEKVIFSIMNQFKNWQWIIAPHEIDENHLYQIECLIKNNLPNANVIRYSKYESEKNWDIIIVDQFGKLFYLYEFADLAFVGGSFKDKVHSVMEPLAYNKFVLVGPHFKNNREAIEFNQIKVTSSLPIVSSVKSDLEMKKVLVEIENLSPEDKASHQKKIEKMVTEKMKATDRIYELINGSDSIN